MTPVERPDHDIIPDGVVPALTEPPAACSYLGFQFDRASRANFPWAVHHCWRADTSVLVDTSWQASTCLTTAHLGCPRFRDSVAAVPAPVPRVPARTRPRWLLPASAALIFLVVAIGGGVALARAARRPAPASTPSFIAAPLGTPLPPTVGAFPYS